MLCFRVGYESLCMMLYSEKKFTPWNSFFHRLHSRQAVRKLQQKQDSEGKGLKVKLVLQMMVVNGADEDSWIIEFW